MLVDDHALFAKSLAIALEEYSEIEHFIITQETEGLSDLVLREHIDIVLMDINLGKLSENDGLTLARRLLKAIPDLKRLCQDFFAKVKFSRWVAGSQPAMISDNRSSSSLKR